MSRDSDSPRPDGGRSGPLGGSFGSRVFIIWFILSLVFLFWMVRPLNSFFQGETRISYSDFRAELERENIRSVRVKGEEITGELRRESVTLRPDGEEVSYLRFITYLPSFGDDRLLAELESQKVVIQTAPAGDFPWWLLMANILPFFLLVGLLIFFFRQAQARGQGIFQMGRSGARAYDRSGQRTVFEDVAGSDEAKKELREIIEFLKDPGRFQKLGGNIPRGVLLVGPPGTGKTLLARAVAGEADVPFFSITGSDFMEMLVGVGASRVRDLFKKAKSRSPSIIFIDELDSIGRRRGAGLGGGHDEREQTLNQLLSELDGFEAKHSVVVVAATNRPDILDPALLRPGRFDRRITVDLPTLWARHHILKIHTRNKPLDPDIDLEGVARTTPGFSGADLENLMNEAALLAARKNSPRIENRHVEEARDKILMGLVRENLALTDREREKLAYHEAGHAVLAVVLEDSDPVHKVTIVPRGRAMGVTQQLPSRDRYVYDRDYLLNKITLMMGGRAAEQLVFGNLSSGAADDLKQATQLVRKMVLDWGMSERLGPVALDSHQGDVFLGDEIARRREYSESTARLIDEEIKRILRECLDRALELLEKHREGLDRLAKTLLEEEEVDGARVLELLARGSEETPGDEGRPKAVEK